MNRTLRALLTILFALIVPMAALANGNGNKCMEPPPNGVAVAPKGSALKAKVEALRTENSTRYGKADLAASASVSASVALTKQRDDLQKALGDEKKVDVIERHGCNDEGIVCLSPMGSVYGVPTIRSIDAGATLTVKVIGSDPDLVNQSITITSRVTRDKIWAPGVPSASASAAPAGTDKPVAPNFAATPESHAKGDVVVSAEEAKKLAEEQATEKDIANPPDKKDVAKWKVEVQKYYDGERQCWDGLIAERVTAHDKATADITDLKKKVDDLKAALAVEVAKHRVTLTEIVTSDTASTWMDIRYRADKKISETETQKDYVSRGHVVRVRQGRYFIELSVGLAFVLGGKRTVGPVAEIGSGEQRLTIKRDLLISPTFNVNWFILGRERNRVSIVPTDPAAGCDWRGLLGLQFGTTLNLANRALNEWYIGLVLEPVTGFSMSAGLAAVKGEFLPAGTYEGQLIPRGTSFTPDTKYMPKGYFGVSVSLDILDTISRAFSSSRTPSSN